MRIHLCLLFLISAGLFMHGCSEKKKPAFFPPAAGGGIISLSDWFKDYNNGMGTAYLSEPFEYYDAGDSRHSSAAAHEFYGNVSYGPYEKNLLDFWQLDNAAAPTPVIVYIHGGGFISGDKDGVNSPLSTINNILAEGISVASINYRLKCSDKDIAVTLPIPNGTGDGQPANGVRLDYILRDCARAIQFLRYKAADWNIDKNKIAAYGGSAGAGAAMWIGTVPDLADPGHADPVLRESSRLSAIGHSNSQPTYNWPRWPELLQMDPDFVSSHISDDDIGTMQMSREDMVNTEEGRNLCEVLDYYEYISSDDCPVITVNHNPDLSQAEITSDGQVIHHPRAHYEIYLRCKSFDLECEIDTVILKDSPHNGNVIRFLIDILNQ